MSLRELLASPGSSPVRFPPPRGRFFCQPRHLLKPKEATSPKWPKWTDKFPLGAAHHRPLVLQVASPWLQCET